MMIYSVRMLPRMPRTILRFAFGDHLVGGGVASERESVLGTILVGKTVCDGYSFY